MVRFRTKNNRTQNHHHADYTEHVGSGNSSSISKGTNVTFVSLLILGILVPVIALASYSALNNSSTAANSENELSEKEELSSDIDKYQEKTGEAEVGEEENDSESSVLGEANEGSSSNSSTTSLSISIKNQSSGASEDQPPAPVNESEVLLNGEPVELSRTGRYREKLEDEHGETKIDLDIDVSNDSNTTLNVTTSE